MPTQIALNDVRHAYTVIGCSFHNQAVQKRDCLFAIQAFEANASKK